MQICIWSNKLQSWWRWKCRMKNNKRTKRILEGKACPFAISKEWALGLSALRRSSQLCFNLQPVCIPTSYRSALQLSRIPQEPEHVSEWTKSHETYIIFPKNNTLLPEGQSPDTKYTSACTMSFMCVEVISEKERGGIFTSSDTSSLHESLIFIGDH